MKKYKKILMYTKIPCPFCVAARHFFENHNIPFTEIDLTHDVDQLIAIKQKWGWSTVPIILVEDELIGGYTDLKALYDKGLLESIILQ